MSDDRDCLPLPALTMGEIASLFPDKHEVSVYRWRSTKGKNRLPEPDFVPAGNQQRALWSVETVVGWAERAGLEIDADVLARIVGTH